jgi:heptosyltransferase III
MNPRRILLIRRDNIGDLVCTTPAIAALRQHYPEAEIAALVNSYNAEVLRGNPDLNRIFVYQKLKHAGGLASRIAAIVERLQLIRTLRRWKPDVTILAKAGYERHGLNFARQIGAKNVIGYVPADLALAKGLPDIQLATPAFNTLHEVEAVSGLLKPLDINHATGPLAVYPDPAVVARLSAKLPPASRRIALHISAREVSRRWGTEQFIALGQHILDQVPDTQILLFWSPGSADDPHHPGDDAAAAQLMAAINSDRLVPMPTQNLTELIAALSLCELFIGTDGGAMHLAVALNKKILSLFENLPEKLNHWYPWQVQYRLVHSKNAALPNIDQITQDQVKTALAELLQS